MATIRARQRSDGSIGYTVQVRIKDEVQVYTESQTFARKKAAEACGKRRETELSESGGGAIHSGCPVSPVQVLVDYALWWVSAVLAVARPAWGWGNDRCAQGAWQVGLQAQES